MHITSVRGTVVLLLVIGLHVVARGAAPTKGQSGEGKVDWYGDPLPPGALARLGTVRYRFASAASVFLPDGKTVVSATQNSLLFWNPRTGRPLREIDMGHFLAGGGGMGGFALSKDGKRLALSGSVHDDGIPPWRPAAAVFDLASGKAIRIVERQPLEGVHGLTMSPDGKLLFTLDRHGKLRVEEVETGAELLTQQFPGDVMARLSLSADGEILALGSGPNTHKIFLWKWQSGEEPREAASGQHRGRDLAFSPDGKLLAECSDSQPDIRVVDVASGKLVRKLEQPDHEPFRHYNLAFAPNGKMLAAYGGTNDQSAINLWEPASGKFVKRIPLGGSLAFSPNSSLLIAGSRVWDLVRDKELSVNDAAHRGAITGIRIGPQDTIVTSSDDNTLRVWDAATGKHLRCLTLDSSIGMSISAFAVSPDGKHLVNTSMRDDQVLLWELTTGKRIYRLPGHGKMGSYAAAAIFLPDGKTFLTWAAADMCLRQWDVRTGKALAEHVIRPAGMHVPSEDDEPMERDRHFMSFHGAHFTADARWLVFQAGAKWYVFDAATGKAVRSFPTEASFQIGTAISPDSTLLLASAYGKQIQTQLPGGGVQFSTPKDHPLTFWDLQTGEVRKQRTLPEETPGPVAFSADGKLFAVASSGPGTKIRIMETASGREVRKIDGFRGSVRSLAFLPDGTRLVAGMENSALIWDLNKDR